VIVGGVVLKGPYLALLVIVGIVTAIAKTSTIVFRTLSPTPFEVLTKGLSCARLLRQRLARLSVGLWCSF
jgi:hypothetical protein